MSRRWLWVLVAVAIVVGIALRCEHAERRLFWGDETWTALRVSGHTYVELRAAFDDRLHSTKSLTTFQTYDPRRGVGYTVGGLAKEEPQHPPLFYVIDRYWAEFFGSSIPSLRAPAVFFSLTAIAAFAWFLIELGGSRAVGAAAAGAALMAVSPFFVDYAAQAREYSLWATMIAVTSALLLRATRKPAASIWIWYAIAMTIGLYSDLLMVCVLAAHALYIVVVARRREIVLPFAAASAVALAAFSPWLAVCATHAHTIEIEQAWGFNPYPLRLDFEKWIFNAAAVLFDAEYADMLLAPLGGLLLILMLYAAIRVLRDEAPRVWWLLVALGGVVAAQQILTDVVTHGHESTTARYLLPLWLVTLAAVAMFFGRRMLSEDKLRPAWFAGFCGVVALSMFSSILNSQAVVWWDNNDNTPSTTMAAQINASGAAPLVVSEGHWGEVLVMTHYVKPQTQFFLFKFLPPFPIPSKTPAFLLMPSKRTLAAFREHPGYDLVPVPIAPLTSRAVLTFHENVGAAQRGLSDRVRWDTAYLFRLETRVAKR